ncbi:hypothetical protein TRVA0_021S00232 [Trichomonascus vanleenenianus]|uniref:uncharacterized protein n=1 Tax=Trichomonascus vanleenenianus TaxID=2268995 RepID=UPI003EC9F0F2
MEDIDNAPEDNYDLNDFGGERVDRLSSSLDGFHFARSPPNSSYFNLATTTDRTSSHHQRYNHYRRRNSASSPKNISISLSPQDPPDSPELEPVSLGSSPTGLNLSMSPPASTSESKNTLTLNLSPVNSMPSVTTGCTSPLLEPVATPSEDPPMTPMVLDS